MAGGYTYLNHLSPIAPALSDGNVQKFVSAVALGFCLYAIGKSVSKPIRDEKGKREHIIPDKRISLRGFLDFFVSAFTSLHDSILGKENRRYVGFTGSIFLFILLANLIGLVPGMPAITTTVWVNVGMALVVFVYFNYQGVREHGALNYIKHFGGPVWWAAVLIFPVEIFSTVLRVLTLNLRLYWNISADHLVLDIFTNEVVGWVIPSMLYLLGIFVSFIQAFIFAVLTIVYILLATQHDEEH